jgi:hypothetical protein
MDGEELRLVEVGMAAVVATRLKVAVDNHRTLRARRPVVTGVEVVATASEHHHRHTVWNVVKLKRILMEKYIRIKNIFLTKKTATLERVSYSYYPPLPPRSAKNIKNIQFVYTSL